MHGGDRIAAVLEARGVRFVFTLCGGHISPILVGSKARGIRVVDVRHEATAVFAADATARLTGIPGVAAVTAGPGATNTITAVKNAQLAQSPVVLLVGAAPTALRGRGALQDIDQASLLRPHVKWMARLRRVRDLAPAVERAFDVASRGVPGPVAVECPVDLLYDEPVVREWYGAGSGGGKSIEARVLRWYLARHLNRVFAGAGAKLALDAARDPTARTEDPPAAAVRRAARHLARAERPVLLIGSQAMLEPRRANELAAAVETLGVPTFLSGMARGLLGRDHPLQIRHNRRAAFKEADVVLLAGVPCDFRLDYGKQIRRGATLIAANRSRRDLRLNRRPTLPVPADPGRFIEALAGACDGRLDGWRAWHDRLRERDDARERAIEDDAGAVGDGVNPLQLCREIERSLPDEAVLVVDGGDFVATASYIVRPRGPLSWLDPGAFGTLGVGAGFALGAKLCRPESEVWILYGDGSFGYSLIELDTFVRHDLPVVAVVGNDACWMQIARDQIALLKDDVGCRLLPTDYHLAAEGLGAAGFAVAESGRVEETLARARQAAREGRPALINARIGSSAFRKGSISI